MSIVETYVPFTRKPPSGKRNRPGRVRRSFIGNGGAPAGSVPPAALAVPRLNFTGAFWFRFDLGTRLCNIDL